MKKIKQQLIVSLLFLFGLIGYGQEVSFTTSVSAKKIGVTDRFQVTYSCNKQGSFITPRFNHFTQLGGVSQGSNSSVNIINGQVTQKVTYSYSIILQPKKTGVFNVEGAKIKVGNTTYESKSVEVEVVKESQARQRNRPRSIFDQMDDMMRGFPQAQRQPVDVSDQDFFGRISVSKGKVKQNQGFLITYKIYARNFNFGLEKYDFPTQHDFWSEGIKMPNDIKPTNEKVNGVNYQVYTLKKELLFAQKSGMLKLNPFSVTARIQTSPFSPAITKKIVSNSPSIEVASLPQNPPESFTNQVGEYTLKTTFNRDSAQINEPIDFKITISGKGNLKQLNPLELTFPADLEVYDPEVKNKISVSEGGVKGSKIFNYLIIPRESGKYQLPKVEFSYFDVSSNTYKTLSAEDYEIVVTNEDGSISKPQKEEDSSEFAEKVEKENSGFNWMWLLIPLGVIGGVGLWFILIGKSKEETEEERKKNARKKLAQKLAIAKSHLDENEISQFYDEILIGLNNYVNQKLGIQTADMTKESIDQTLNKKGVNAETISLFIKVLEQCEMAKYAPLSAQNNEEIYEHSLTVIEEIEGQI